MRVLHIISKGNFTHRTVTVILKAKDNTSKQCMIFFYVNKLLYINTFTELYCHTMYLLIVYPNINLKCISYASFSQATEGKPSVRSFLVLTRKLELPYLPLNRNDVVKIFHLCLIHYFERKINENTQIHL